MDLVAINAFVAVADHGGFRAAAASLGMTSAGVSKAVARLEAELGVTLMARTTRSVRLTSAGAAFHARCRSILADLELAGQEAADGATLPSGRLVISMSRAFGRMRLLPIIADYARLHPQVDMEIRLSDSVADLISDGVDVAIRIGHLPESSLIAARIGQTRFAVAGSPKYLANRGAPRHPDELRHHDMIGYVAPGTALRFAHRFMIDGVSRTIDLPHRLTLDDGEALVAMSLRSLGLVQVNDYLIEPHLADGTLIRVLEPFETAAIPINALYLPARTPSPAIKALTAMLRRRMSMAHG